MKTLQELIEDCRKSRDEETAREIDRLSKTHLARMLLTEAGFAIRWPYYHWSAANLSLTVQKEELVKVREALGCPLRMVNKYPESKDKPKNIIVYLSPTDFPTVEIKYLTPIPKKRRRGSQPKCKLVKRKVPARYEYELVCENKENI